MPANWILRQMFRTGGAHLAKRAKAPFYTPSPSAFERSLDWQRNRKWLAGDEPMSGNLANDQYRFFQGSRITNGTYSKCRVCQETFFNESARVLHVKNSTCQRVFNDALKVFMGNHRSHIKLMKCSACDTETYSSKWGIPLCLDAECIEKWKFDILIPADMLGVLIGLKNA
jgi:hypothetical protein